MCVHTHTYVAWDKEALVSDYMDSSGSYVHCNPTFIRALQDWELESLVAFLNLLYTSKTHPREVDKTLWSPARNHKFGVKSYYFNLRSDESSLFP
jgi:hypothetical protein